MEVALSNIQKIMQSEENDKIRALYGAGNYCLSLEYRKFKVASHVWHCWSEESKQITSENLGNTYQIFLIHFVCQLMLAENLATNTGTETQQSDIVLDRIEESTSGNSLHCTTSCTVSFRDPRATAEKEFE